MLGSVYELVEVKNDARWNNSNRTVFFIMLNPSRADAKINDLTITRCINFALSWGYGRLEVANLFAYRTSKPSLLKQADVIAYILASASAYFR